MANNWIDTDVFLEEIGEDEAAKYWGLLTQEEADKATEEAVDEAVEPLEERIQELWDQLQQALGNE